MKAITPWLSALLLAALGAGVAQAYYPACSPVFHRPLGQAPDCCGPGWYCACPDGTFIGPNYYLVPPFPPFNGFLPGRNGAGPGCGNGNGNGNGSPSFPTHPYARSPRDFFMWSEAQQDLHTRQWRIMHTPPAPAGFSASFFQTRSVTTYP